MAVIRRSFVTRELLSPQMRSLWTPSGRHQLDLDGCSEDVGVMPKSEHWRTCAKNNTGQYDLRLPHAAYTREQLDNVEATHMVPETKVDKAAWTVIRILRTSFDIFTGYALGIKNEAAMIRRVVFLETVAAIPGMVAATIRHLRSLRKMSNDFGYIHTLLEEAENERMHLLTAMLLSNPGMIMRSMVHVAQWIFLAWYTTMYSISPYFCHRMVGYLEEEAVKTYTAIIEAIDKNKLPGFLIPAPVAARAYWGLPADATLRDMWLAIRADEAHHREVNHTIADLTTCPNAVNPFPPGY